MKGVVLGETDARLVDIAHDFPRQDVRTTAFWLREILPYFPPAVHLVVVDPGVGTARNALVIRAGEHALVGPDNGVLVPAARRLATHETSFEALTIASDAASATFHGRDVFAPAAAAVHEVGVDAIEALAGYEPIDEIGSLEFPEPTIDGGVATGEILVVDGFGNAITNISGTVLDGHVGGELECNGESVRVERSYAHVEVGERLLTVGSHENVELAVNRGRGAEAFGVGVGESVRLSLD